MKKLVITLSFLVTASNICGADSTRLSALKVTLNSPILQPAAKIDAVKALYPLLDSGERREGLTILIKNQTLLTDDQVKELISELVPQTPAQFAQKFANTITQNAVPIAGNFKENTPVATLGNKAPSDEDIKLMKTAVRKLADQIGA